VLARVPFERKSEAMPPLPYLPDSRARQSQAEPHGSISLCLLWVKCEVTITMSHRIARKGRTMGISDLDETRSPEEVREIEELQALHDRGYTDPVKICGGDKVHLPYPNWKLALRMHTPCGQAVFDPDQHDRYCPAIAVRHERALWDSITDPLLRSEGATF